MALCRPQVHAVFSSVSWQNSGDWAAKAARDKATRAYTIGWVCVLGCEQDAARAFLDKEHEGLPNTHDQNAYIVGRRGKHNIVIARLIGLRTANAADTAANMLRTFTQIHFGLLAGVGGAPQTAPGEFGRRNDIRLGDVVVSKPQKYHVGLTYFRLPGGEHDLLFCATHCDPSQIMDRVPRPGDRPSVHYRLIASAVTTVRSPTFGDRLRRSNKVPRFEQEAAGLLDHFPHLVIWGIADYADSHKSKKWQPYAAVIAATYGKDLLAVIHPQEVAERTLAAEVSGGMYECP
ncbi:nucleoside phosphorylase domain-containing protein [Aspergillus alliaceus]|uniref:Nucleoside phosphorylase domain-containing protein n=1 Tax=Petromyces alliaceus TaxID=209559 RepID=A0A5N7C7F2_PETAA|nr:nucleoside phosphorylase domain-containing protein [Aspergillus alliaceus]